MTQAGIIWRRLVPPGGTVGMGNRDRARSVDGCQRAIKVWSFNKWLVLVGSMQIGYHQLQPLNIGQESDGHNELADIIASIA